MESGGKEKGEEVGEGVAKDEEAKEGGAVKEGGEEEAKKGKQDGNKEGTEKEGGEVKKEERNIEKEEDTKGDHGKDDKAAEDEQKPRGDKAEKAPKAANGSRVDGSQSAGVAGHQQNGFARPPGMDPRGGYMPSPMHSYGPQPAMEGPGAQNGMNMPYAMPPPYGYYGDRMPYQGTLLCVQRMQDNRSPSLCSHNPHRYDS